MFFRLLITLSFIAAQGCSRVTYRKEISDMTDADWQVYYNTLVTAQQRGILEAQAVKHNQYSNVIHYNSMFFPWHRAFIRETETQLQAINSSFFFPWVDEAVVQDALPTTNLYLLSGRAVNPARNYNFAYPYIEDPEIGLYFDYADSLQGFADWSLPLELAHGNLHLNLGGSMATMLSPRDPLFYSHHGYLDYLWASVQIRWANNTGKQVGGTLADNSILTMSASLMGFNYRFQDVFSPAQLCVNYLPRGSSRPVTTTIASTSTANPVTETPTAAASATTANTATQTPTTTGGPRPTGICQNEGRTCSGSTPCCSQWGYCGSTSDFCGVGCNPLAGRCDGSPSVTTAVVSASPTTVVITTTAMTGSVNPTTTAGPRPTGICQNEGVTCSGSTPCCSQWGYCGSTSDFCGAGCNPLAGRCDGQALITTVGASVSPTTTAISPTQSATTGQDNA